MGRLCTIKWLYRRHLWLGRDSYRSSALRELRISHDRADSDKECVVPERLVSGRPS